jgi:hypothetical protein
MLSSETAPHTKYRKCLRRDLNDEKENWSHVPEQTSRLTVSCKIAFTLIFGSVSGVEDLVCEVG